MLKQITLKNWKSYRDSTIYIDPLTVLIGTNASGKSNVLDAFQLLNRISNGVSLTSALAGDVNINGIRGGLEWACLKPESHFAIEAISGLDSDEQIEFQYSIEVQIQDTQAVVLSESLVRVKKWIRSDRTSKISLFVTDKPSPSDPHITARLYNEKRGSPRVSSRSTTILSQLATQKTRKEIDEGVEQIVRDLRGIFILDPIPSHMRAYSALSDHLEPDASNIAGVLEALDSTHKEEIVSVLTSYVKNLPEKDIVRVYTEPVGKFSRDAMLYCDEKWGDDGQIHSVDARGMSDGSLRFLAILTALLTRPEKSILIVEEIDNGLHPSRSELLIRMLKEIGLQRGIDVLITTHNAALLDAFGPEIIPFICVAYRHKLNGESELKLLEDIKQLPKLLAYGPVGKLISNGKIESALNG